MKLQSNSFVDGAAIPGEFAFAVVAPSSHVSFSTNRNPHLAWSDVPAGTRSFALVCHDPDVPSRGDDVNEDGREVPVSLPRVDFYHWILLDLPATTHELVAGSHSEGVTPRVGPANWRKRLRGTKGSRARVGESNGYVYAQSSSGLKLRHDLQGGLGNKVHG